MDRSHSLLAWLTRQPTEILHQILFKEFLKKTSQNATFILTLLYLLKMRDDPLPEDLLQAWKEYLHEVFPTASDILI